LIVEGDLTFRESARKLADVIEAMALKLEDTAGLLKKERLLLAGKDYASLQSLLKELERSVSDFWALRPNATAWQGSWLASLAAIRRCPR